MCELTSGPNPDVDLGVKTGVVSVSTKALYQSSGILHPSPLLFCVDDGTERKNFSSSMTFNLSVVSIALTHYLSCPYFVGDNRVARVEVEHVVEKFIRARVIYQSREQRCLIRTWQGSKPLRNLHFCGLTGSGLS